MLRNEQIIELIQHIELEITLKLLLW